MDITAFIISRRNSAELLGNYGAYGRQLSNRLHTVRSSLARGTQKPPRILGTSGITAEDLGRDKRFVELCLLFVERGWSRAMHLRSEHSEDNNGAGPSGAARSHIISKFHKASRQAQDFARLLAEQDVSGATDVDVLEAKAYAFTLLGALELEKQSGHLSHKEPGSNNWKQCLENYSAARVIYGVLLKATKKDEVQDMLTTVVDPGVKYAAYQSALPRTLAVSVLAVRSFPRADNDLVTRVEKLDANALTETVSSKHKDLGEENIPTSVTWRSRTAKIQDAAVGQAIAMVTAASYKLSSFLDSSDAPRPKKAMAYDDVLLASQEAVDATRHAIEAFEREQIDESDSRMQDLRVTNLVVNYDLIGWRVGRNRVLIGEDDGASREPAAPAAPPRKSKKPKPNPETANLLKKAKGARHRLATCRERIVLYDSILQSVDSVKEIAGAGRDPSFIKHLDDHKAYFQSLKCLNIAFSHAELVRPRNALALLLRAKSLADSAAQASNTTTPASEGPPKLEVDKTRMQNLQVTIESLIHHYAGLVELQAAMDSAKKTANAQKGGSQSMPPLVTRLDEYPTGGVDLTNLVQYPPKLEPVPVKPLFFDVADNYVNYPGQQQKQAAASAAGDGKAETAQEQKPAARKGWFSFGR